MRFLPVALAILAVSYFRRYDAGKELATQRGDEWLFRGGRLLRGIVLYGFGAMFMLAVRTLFADQASQQMFGILFALIAFPLYLFLLPRTIIASPSGLDKRGWRYQRHSLPWKNIVRAASDNSNSTILIYADGGSIISHTRYHSGRAELISLLRKNRIPIN